jgi:hypothetical protein
MPILYTLYRQKRGFLASEQPKNGPTDGSPRTHSRPWGTRAYGVLRDVGRQGVSEMRRLRVRLMVVHWIPVLLVEFVWVAKNESSPAVTGEPKDKKSQ